MVLHNMRARKEKSLGLRDYIWGELLKQVPNAYLSKEFQGSRHIFASSIDPKKKQYRAVVDGNMSMYNDVASLMTGLFKGKVAIVTIESVYPEENDLFPKQADKMSASLKPLDTPLSSPKSGELQPRSDSQNLKKKRLITPLIKQEGFDKKLKQEDSPTLFINPQEVRDPWQTDDEFPFGIVGLSDDEQRDKFGTSVHYPDIGISIKTESVAAEPVLSPLSRTPIKTEETAIKTEQEEAFLRTPDHPADLLDATEVGSLVSIYFFTDFDIEIECIPKNKAQEFSQS